MAVPRDPGPGGSGGYGTSPAVGLTIGAWVALAIVGVLLVDRWPEAVYGTLILALLYLAVSRSDELTDAAARLVAGLANTTS